MNETKKEEPLRTELLSFSTTILVLLKWNKETCTERNLLSNWNASSKTFWTWHPSFVLQYEYGLSGTIGPGVSANYTLSKKLELLPLSSSSWSTSTLVASALRRKTHYMLDPDCKFLRCMGRASHFDHKSLFSRDACF